jgi:hypothetical protein
LLRHRLALFAPSARRKVGLSFLPLKGGDDLVWWRNRNPAQSRAFLRGKLRRDAMGKGLLLWLIGIPIPIIILLWLFGVFS